MILNGSGSRSAWGTPSGRQFKLGLPYGPAWSCRRNISAPAAVSGSSPGLKSDRMFLKYFELGDSPNPNRPGPRGSASTCQIPERSGLPFTRGAGPVIFTLPSAVRGAPAVGWFTHWACATKPPPRNTGPIQKRLLISVCLAFSVDVRGPDQLAALPARRRLDWQSPSRLVGGR